MTVPLMTGHTNESLTSPNSLLHIGWVSSPICVRPKILFTLVLQQHAKATNLNHTEINA